jgi:hypothetical protein
VGIVIGLGGMKDCRDCGSKRREAERSGGTGIRPSRYLAGRALAEAALGPLPPQLKIQFFAKSHSVD